MQEKKEILDLINRSFTDQLTTEEFDTLNHWVSESSENKREYEAYSQIWNKSIEPFIVNRIDLESSLQQTKRKIPEFRVKRQWIRYTQQAAAVLFISVSLSVAYNFLANRKHLDDTKDQLVYQEVKIAFGMHSSLRLPDSTMVWLNSGSTLKFPLSFKNQKERKVILRGEGYFVVTKNEKHPFIVSTENIDIKVLGTSFNVMAYDNSHKVTVALEKGKVTMIKGINREYKDLITLNPMEVAEYNTDAKNVSSRKEKNLDKYTAWKENRIVFSADPIETVVTKLENWYNVDIVVDSKVLTKYHFTATFIDESLEQILKMLSLSTPINYRITSASKNPDNSFSKRKIILTAK